MAQGSSIEAAPLQLQRLYGGFNNSRRQLSVDTGA
jgi:hypothetical protein